MIKNLLYHIYPKGEIWRWNVSQLLQRFSTFNGQKVVAVTTDSTTATFNEVKQLFSHYRLNGKITTPQITFHHFQNDPKLGEVRSFETLLKAVENVDPRQITFYGHAKGVKYTEKQIKQYKVHTWSQVMYSVLLDYPALIEDSLRPHKIVGTFIKSGNVFGEHRPTWHFAGTFFWFRNDALFSDPGWNHIDPMWYGTEEWPGRLFDRKHATHLLLEGKAPNMQLYEKQYWIDNVDSKWHSFQVTNASLKRYHTYQEVLAHLKSLNVKRVLIAGPQRSGTTITSLMFSRDLHLPCLAETDFNTHDFQAFNNITKRPAFVLQCPTMTPYIHLIPGVHVIYMRRPLTDVIRSQKRIGWEDYEQLERDRYFYHGSREAAAVKMDAWERFQRIILGERALDLDYASLEGHPLWVGKESRGRFGPRQTYPSR